MVRDLFLTLLAMAAVVIAVTFFLTVPQEWRREEAASQSAEDVIRAEDYTYELKALEGKLAVYFLGEKYPRVIFDVYIRTLPKLDQEQLNAGIPIKDYEELLKRIEDYSS